MSGKSTYLRQVALCCVMAQVGSFVPAAFASLPPRDRLLSRLGTGDSLESCSSSFLLEMQVGMQGRCKAFSIWRQLNVARSGTMSLHGSGCWLAGRWSSSRHLALPAFGSATPISQVFCRRWPTSWAAPRPRA